MIDRGFVIHNSYNRPIRMTGAMFDISDLKEAIQSRDELVAVISHELKNPLTAISTSRELIERTLSSITNDEKVRATLKLLARINTSTQRIVRLVNDLLDITRLEAGAMPLVQEAVSLAPLINSTLEAWQLQAQEKSLVLKKELSIPTPPPAYADPNLVMRVLSNLIGNAIKFTQEKGIIRVGTKQMGDKLQVWVQDNGPGIEEDHLPHIFDRFWQAKQMAYKGTGLGLSIAKGIVEAHGGRIWAESRPGQGSSIYFTLPITSSIQKTQSKAA